MSQNTILEFWHIYHFLCNYKNTCKLNQNYAIFTNILNHELTLENEAKFFYMGIITSQSKSFCDDNILNQLISVIQTMVQNTLSLTYDPLSAT